MHITIKKCEKVVDFWLKITGSGYYKFMSRINVNKVCVCVSAPAALCSHLGLHLPGHTAADRPGNLPEGSGISCIFFCCELIAM